MEEQWEYLTLPYPIDFCLDDNLNLMGEIGWEAFAVTTYELNKIMFIRVFFKRKIQR